MRPRLLGEIVVRTASAAVPPGRAPDPDPDAVSRLIARRRDSGAQSVPVTGADDVARLAARRAAATPDTPAPERPTPPEHDAVARLAARRTHLTVPSPDEQEQ